MAFMTPAEIKSVRLQGSKVIRLESVNKEVRIIKLAADAQLMAIDLQAEVKAGRKPRADTVLFTLQHGLTDLEGNPFTADDAAAVAGIITLPELMNLVNSIAELVDGGVKMKVSEGPAEELTPAAKKD